jgi:sugar phosphate isomerase/epimerase
MALLSRRHFVKTCAVSALSLTAASAIEPIVRPGPIANLKLSLAAYSFRQKLDLKKPSMTLFDFIDLAATYPLDAVELTSYYFAETTPDYLKKLRDHAAAKKLTISGVPVGNTFTLKDDTKRKAEIDKVKAWIERGELLGAPTVRIFAGNLEKGETLEQAQARVVAAIEECCLHAEKHKVMLALENHGGITATPDQLLALVKPITSKYLGVNIDTGNFRTADPYADVAKIAPYGVVCQIKTELFPMGKPKAEADLGKMVGILKKANYHGYVTLEYEAAEDASVAVPKYLKELRTLLSE